MPSEHTAEWHAGFDSACQLVQGVLRGIARDMRKRSKRGKERANLVHNCARIAALLRYPEADPRRLSIEKAMVAFHEYLRNPPKETP